MWGLLWWLLLALLIFKGGVLGVLLGLVITAWLFRRAIMRLGGEFKPFGADLLRRREVFSNATFAVMGHVTKASGQVTEAEIQLASTLMSQMHLSGPARTAAQEAFRRGKQPDFPLRQTLHELRQALAGRRDIMQFFLEMQVAAAFADGELHPGERQILQIVASELGFSEQALSALLARMQASWRQGGAGGAPASSGMSTRDAYELLGVSEQSTPQEIKRAYRRLMSQHHPDKLEARGLPPEMKQLAKEKAQQIQKAYERIKQVRGFK